ncbi:MAG: UxaA family hydrolase [Betaproteobacteria bacterium]|nr:MAG: UxaA family hydrolase [Betaproteobacteria bacterium]
MNDKERKTDSRVLLMAPDDNVAIAKTDLAASTTLQVMGSDITLRDKVLTGHKFAFMPVAKGATIVKYGAPIGIATQDIVPGESMHLHNIASDYIPTYTLDEGHQFLEE